MKRLTDYIIESISDDISINDKCNYILNQLYIFLQIDELILAISDNKNNNDLISAYDTLEKELSSVIKIIGYDSIDKAKNYILNNKIEIADDKKEEFVSSYKNISEKIKGFIDSIEQLAKESLTNSYYNYILESEGEYDSIIDELEKELKIGKEKYQNISKNISGDDTDLYAAGERLLDNYKTFASKLSEDDTKSLINKMKTILDALKKQNKQPLETKETKEDEENNEKIEKLAKQIESIIKINDPLFELGKEKGFDDYNKMAKSFYSMLSEDTKKSMESKEVYGLIHIYIGIKRILNGPDKNKAVQYLTDMTA